jgi:methionine synthase II (cobalamin-independent)
MDRTQHKLAMEFFRSEIKTLAKRLEINKQALRLNQRSASQGLPGNAYTYDISGEKYWYRAENVIRNDKARITALHVVYGELRGKPHLIEEKKEQYVSDIEISRKRMEEYIEKKQVALVSNSSTGTGGI